ncbi:uncharacterized protein E0L32_003617 [Thyridium curvatum]|uniref:Vacuolar membrane protein n=1 Tax=Thyridium curvatum TaxID=1093900 RepID=A0A507BBR5_9PEZI|nr:uncharacterized protein E0L32_003617 [Thyridium curvatum]TPX16676.1 hypothetical protein E0L32_003617 [Thyridium curvatum]
MAAPAAFLPALAARLPQDAPFITPTGAAAPAAEVATVGIMTVPNDDSIPSETVDAVIVTLTPSPTPPDQQQQQQPPTPPEKSVFHAERPSPSAPAPASSTATAGSPYKKDKPADCELLGPFALLVQLALGGLALLSLVYKRWRERPQRPVKIWFFDVSKQVFGSVLVHISNVFMSMLTSGRFSVLEPGTAAAGGVGGGVAARLARSWAPELLRRAAEDEYTPNPCSFYLLNLGIDTTLGIPILIVLLRITTALVSYTPLGQPPESIRSGYYGRPPNAWWWLKQSVIYFCGLFGMKLCVLVIFLLLPWISRVGDWALGWTEGNEQLQIVFVMMIFPLVMNAAQYYIIDSFIKQREAKDEHGEGGNEIGGPRYDHVPGQDDDDVGEEEELEDEDREGHRVQQKQGGSRTTTTTARKDSREYDPDVDGDGQTVFGSSSSKGGEPRSGKLVPEELYPHE